MLSQEFEISAPPPPPHENSALHSKIWSTIHNPFQDIDTGFLHMFLWIMVLLRLRQNPPKSGIRTPLTIPILEGSEIPRVGAGSYFQLG